MWRPLPPMRIARAVTLVAVGCLALAGLSSSARSTAIVGATIADGKLAHRCGPPRSGFGPPDRIVSVGDSAPDAADAIIDAKGLVLAPGFIDIHNHSTTGLDSDPAAETQVAQGITTIVVGADGSSPWPIAGYWPTDSAVRLRSTSW